MKNLIRVAAAAAIIMGFTACQKEGVFNPKKKISEIYSYAETTYNRLGLPPATEKGEKRLEQVWTWDNNLLKSIEYKDYNDYPIVFGNRSVAPKSSNFTYFEYNKSKQLLQVTDGDGMVWKYEYNKSKLDKIDAWSENENLFTIKFEHKNNKISKITFFVLYDDDDWKYKNSIKREQISSIMQFVLPKPFCEQLSAEISKRSVSKTTKSFQLDALIVELKWKGDNIMETSVALFGENIKYVTYYEYDKKKNPFYNNFSCIENGEVFLDGPLGQLSANNITKLRGAQAQTADNSIIYEYVYDGNYPIEVIETQSDTYIDFDYLTLTTRTTKYTTYYNYK